MKVTGNGPGSTEKLRESGNATRTESAGEAKSRRRAEKLERGGESAEKVQISSRAKDAAKAKELAKAAPDGNEEKIARLKAAIQNNTYKADADKIADKLVTEHLATPLA